MAGFPEIASPDLEVPGGIDTELQKLARRVSNQKWWKCARIVYGIPDWKIEEYKKGFVDEEDMYKMIKAHLWNEPGFAWRHRDKIKKSEISREIELLGADQAPEGELLREAIYAILASIVIKNRAKFCVQELQMQPPDRMDIPIDMDLKMEMLRQWWIEMAGEDHATLARVERKTEKFFMENPGSEVKTGMKVNNLFLNCGSVTLNESH